ncbi:MAG: nitroreductase family protein [Dehalococcoidia bacterium]
MEVLQAIKERRSIRRYRPDPVSDEAISTILDAARWAPSWSNTQCWRFVVVRDPELKGKLRGALRYPARDAENPAASAFSDAPVVIAACAELGKSGYYHGEPTTDKGDWFMFDVALAMQNLTLAAHDAGLATVHVGLFDAKEVARLLGVPEGVAVVVMTPLGYPDEAHGPIPRKDLADIVFQDKYGEKWP